MKSNTNEKTLIFIREVENIVQKRLEPLDLSIEQVSAIIGTFTSNSANRRIFEAYYKYITEN